MKNNNIIVFYFIMLLGLIIPILAKSDVYNDKYSIKKCFEANIEYFRQYSKAHDLLNFYKPYSNENDNVITIDTLIYRPDSLMAFTFVLISDTANLYYDAKALICYRKDKNELFQIYPVTVMSILHHDNAEEALFDIRYYYQNNLKNHIDRWKFEYVSNLGDPEFWDKSLYFKKINSKYYFELKYKLNNYEIEYEELNYLKCNCK